MKDKIHGLMASLDIELPWQFFVIAGIKILGYGLLALCTAIEEKRID